MNWGPLYFFVHGILQARILEWIAIFSFRGSSPPRDQTRVSCIAGRFFIIWTTRASQFSGFLVHLNCHHQYPFPKHFYLPKYKLGIFLGGASCEEPACQCKSHKRYGFSPWVRKVPWRRKWQPTSVFLPGESHGQRSLAATVPGVSESDTAEAT